MPIFLSSSLAPRNGGTWFLLDDKYLKGGFQIVNTATERDAINSLNRKQGMLVLTLDTGVIHKLDADLTSWSTFEVSAAPHTHDFSSITTDSTHRFVTDVEKASWDAKQDALGYTPVDSATVGQANGIAPLDASGKLPTAHLPDLAITDTYVVTSEAEMLAISCQVGDVAVRTDLSKSFILKTADASVLAHWQELLTPTAGSLVSIGVTAPIQNTGTAQAPVIAMSPATASVDGYMTSAYAAKLDSIQAGATAYTHPTGDGNLHVPATGTTNSGKVLTAGATAGSLSWQTPATGVSSVSASAPIESSGGSAPIISMPAATVSNDGYLTAIDWAIFNSKGSVTNVTGSGAISVTNGTTTPVISIADATTSASGAMSASDKLKLDGIATGATAYVHPTGDGNLHVPATGTTNAGKVLTAGATAGSLSWQTPAASGVTAVSANAPIVSSGGTTPTLSIPAATSSVDGYLKATDWIIFNSKGNGTVTNVTGSGAINVANGNTSPVISIANATTVADGAMSAADKAKLDGIAANANNYTHPTGDGFEHVPATGTSNNGKVLTAGSTSGSASWQSLPAFVTGVTANAPIQSSGGAAPVISMPAASSSQNGYLSSTDWTTFNNKGSGTVTSVSGSGSVNGLTLSGTVTSSGNITLGGAITSVSTSANLQMNSLGVGTAASGTAGEVRATGDVTAFYSDGRLKNVIGPIQNALQAVLSLNGVLYTGNNIARAAGFDTEKELVGVIAQEVQKVLPQVVVPAPFDIGQREDGSEYSLSGQHYMTVKYDRIVPLLIEAIKEQQQQIQQLAQQVQELRK